MSRDSNLAYILEQINLHLYRACRKKVFVTMAAVVLDSASRRLEYGRAGHNPVVWRRRGAAQTTLREAARAGAGNDARRDVCPQPQDRGIGTGARRMPSCSIPMA